MNSRWLGTASRFAFAATALCAVASTARAQGVFGRDLRRGVASATAVATPAYESAPEAPDAPARGDRTRARRVVDAAPESFHVVIVDIPDELLADADIRYEVVPSGARLLSARTGVLRPTLGRAQLVLTVQLPAAARAGIAPMAEVVFMGRSRTITTSVDVNVTARLRTVIATTRAVYGARSGERVDVSFTVTNAGNAADTLDLQVLLPADWHLANSPSRSLVLHAGVSKTEVVHVQLPAGLTSGDAAVALVALAHGTERARNSSTVRVATEKTVGQPSASVRTSLTFAADRAGNAQTGMGMDLHAALTSTLAIGARLSGRSVGGIAGATSIQMLSYLPSTNQVTLSSSRWNLQAGAAGTLATELTGQFLAGSGASLQYTDKADGVQVRAMAARPWEGDLPQSGSPLLGFASAQIDKDDAGAWLAASHIDEYRVTPRRLDALAVGGWYQPSSVVRISTEVADREFTGGRGIGYASAMSITQPGSDVSLRVVSAPGGSGANAIATQSATLHATHLLTNRVRLAADGWYAADSSDRTGSVSSGWSATPDLTVAPWLTLGLDARGIAFRSGMVGMGMENIQHQLGLRLRSSLGALQLGAQVTEVAERRNFSASGLDLDESARRLIARTDATWMGEHGDVRAAYSQTSATDWMQAQRAVNLSVDELRPVPSLRNLTVQASAERIMVGGGTLASFHAAVTVALASGTRVQLGMEQNDALKSASGASQGYLFLRVEKSTGFSIPNGPWSRSGVVFRDSNGNGIRDRGEPGFAGLVVRRGNESVVTDASGRFSLPSDFAGDISVDERSLPAGWTVDRSASAHAGHRHEIAIVPTGRVDVSVALRSDAAVSRVVRLGTVALVLTDSVGHSWIARTGPDNHATFDALPLGRYAVRAEADAASEPLIVSGAEFVTVTAASPRQSVSLEASARPVRIFEKPKAGGQ